MASDNDPPVNNAIDRRISLANDMSPTQRNWKNWREKGGAPIWGAVLLSMNIDPIQSNVKALPTDQPFLNKEYKRRCDVVMDRYGLHDNFPVIQNERYGKSPRDRFVMFENLLAFAKEVGWDNLSEFEAGLFPTPAASPGHTSKANSTKEPKGQHYDLVRMGALLELLEKIAHGKFEPTSLLHGEELNLSAVGRQVANIAESRAKRSGYGKEANRKRFDQAKKALADDPD